MTAPRPVTLFALANPLALYPLMLRASGEAILQVGRTWEELRAEMAALALLHTWGQLMPPHLHTHILAPGGGLSLDGSCWVSPALGKFLPIDDLRRLFREFFLKGLRKLYRSGKLVFPDQWRAIEAPADFEKWLSPLAEIDWVIRLRSVWDRTGPEDTDAAARTVEYLARYANRVAISNSRLIAIEGDQVLLRYKDYRDGDQWKTKALPGVEFIRRFLLHVLPLRFRHIRRFGFMGPRVAAKKLELIRGLLGVKKPAPADAPSSESEAKEDADQTAAEEAPRRCRRWNRGELVLVAEVPRPTVAQLMRMHPSMERFADSPRLQLFLPLSAYL